VNLKGAIVAILLAIVCRFFVVSAYKMPSENMAPGILAGDYILATQFSYGLKFPGSSERWFSATPAAGDLVVFIKNGKSFIKRVIGIPGDEVDYVQNEFLVNKNKCTYVTSSEAAEHSLVTEICGNSHLTVRPKDLLNAAVLNPTKLDKGQYLVASDNRIRSENNSSPLEVINYDQIVGKPILIWMSYSSTRDFISDALGVRWNRILTIPK
jgi:signal peptidase I